MELIPAPAALMVVRQWKPRVAVIIPALNEESALPTVLAAIPRELVEDIIVADNGSTDRTTAVAHQGKARVVYEARRGYGAACLAGVSSAGEADILVFMDGDASDDPRELPLLVEPIRAGRADLVIGSRTLGSQEAWALLPQARYGNALATLLIRLLFGRRVTDLGPFRALSRDAYRAIGPDDTGFGFPVQMQVRALARGLRVEEVPVSYRRRIGRSKISGTVRGTVRAGWAIITTILREYWRSRGVRPAQGRSAGEGLPPPTASG